jgi:predicted dehydrogenase
MNREAEFGARKVWSDRGRFMQKGGCMVRVGLIGVSGIGGIHSECYTLLASKKVKVTAVADIDSTKKIKHAKKHGARGFNTGMELIEQAEVDLIDICVPTYLHTEHALAAMDKRRNVLIEKPICLNLAQLGLLQKKQKETGVRVGIAQCLRFCDEYQWLKKAVDERIYGKVKSAVFTRLSPTPTWSSWYLDPEKSGTAALDLHIHDVDVIRYIFGDPGKVQSMAMRDKRGVIAQILTSYEIGDVKVTAEGNWDYPAKYPFSMGYRVNFEEGAAVFDSSQTPSLLVYPFKGSPKVPQFKTTTQKSEQGINVSSLGAYYKELEYFTGCLKQGKQFNKACLEVVSGSLELALQEIKLSGGMVIK